MTRILVRAQDNHQIERGDPLTREERRSRWHVGDIVTVQPEGIDVGFGLKIESLDGSNSWAHPDSGLPISVNPKFVIIICEGVTVDEVRVWAQPTTENQRCGSRFELDPLSVDPRESVLITELLLNRRAIFTVEQLTRTRRTRNVS